MVDETIYTVVHAKHGKVRSHAFYNLGNEDEHAHKVLHEIIDRELESDCTYDAIVCDVCGIEFARS